MTHAHANVMLPPAEAEAGSGVYNEKLGMWVFLASEVMFFTALIGSYIILRFGNPSHWAAPGEILNVPVTAVNTFLLICSSVTMVKAFAAAQDGDQKWLKNWLLATTLIGATFVGVQVYEYLQLAHHGFLPGGYVEGSELAEAAAAGEAFKGGPPLPASVALYGATFFTMTGFHGFHVTMGVICMSFVTFKAFRGAYSVTDHRGVEVIGLYWHFVDLVWIILFTIVYLI
ncbi:MAG TPA: heme-copper oxidase subunit III [Gemmatimonadales bacterium]|nr:heme-copper oxidase subunit III [Gemmatimonadales bacterium]